MPAYGALSPEVGPRDHILGSPDAPVTLVQYADFECPYSALANALLNEVRQRMGARLCLVYRHFPLMHLHPHAMQAAQAAEAAGAQDCFWVMHEVLFEHQDALSLRALFQYARQLGMNLARFADDLADGVWEKRVREDMFSGARSGVDSTPTFFINGELYAGEWKSVPALLGALEQAEASSTLHP